MKKNRYLLYLLVSLCLFCTNTITGLADEYEDARLNRLEMPVESNAVEGWPEGPIVSADAAILYEANTGTILYAKNIYAAEYPASTTKLLTTLIAMEEGDLDDMVTMSQSALDAITWDSSVMGASVGDTFTLEQFLYGILVPSGNEAANAVAEHIGGTMEDFALHMTERAKELGCVNSNFVNANGLYDDAHYTCAYDLALIATEFFKSETLSRIASTSSYSFAEDWTVYSRNKLLPGKEYAYEYLVGSKTGYTGKARNTLASCAQKDGMKLICVVLKEEPPYQFTDTIDLFNYGFSNFKLYNIAENETRYNIEHSDFFESDNDVFGSSVPLLELDTSAGLILPINANFDSAVPTLTYHTDNGDSIATISYSYSGVEVGSCELYLNEDALTAENTDDVSSESVAPIIDATENPPASDSTGLTGDTSSDKSDKDTSKEKEKVIVINIKLIAYWAIGIIGFLLVVFVIARFIGNYHLPSIELKHRRKKRRPKRNRRRKSSITKTYKF